MFCSGSISSVSTAATKANETKAVVHAALAAALLLATKTGERRAHLVDLLVDVEPEAFLVLVIKNRTRCQNTAWKKMQKKHGEQKNIENTSVARMQGTHIVHIWSEQCLEK